MRCSANDFDRLFTIVAILRIVIEQHQMVFKTSLLQLTFIQKILTYTVFKNFSAALEKILSVIKTLELSSEINYTAICNDCYGWISTGPDQRFNFTCDELNCNFQTN